MGWLDIFSASANYQGTDTKTNSTTNSSFTGNSNTSGSQTGTQSGTSTFSPDLSDYWKKAYQSVTGSVGPNGATPEQQTAIDFINKQIQNSTAGAAVDDGNKRLAGVGGGLGIAGDWWANNLNNNSYTLGSLADKAAAGTPGYSSYAAPADVSAPTVSSHDALEKIPQYSEFYDDNLIDPSLKAFDYGTDRAFSALDARTAGAGGFANERSGLGYSDLGTQSALGRGQLYSGLKNLGLTNAAGLATGDVNRMFTADSTNAANSLAAQQFNSGMKNDRQQFDVNAAYRGDDMRMNYANGLTANLLQQAGISQQITNNILTANGIDMSAANALFQAGAISYGQLQAILNAAQASNGGTTTNNQNSNLTSNSNTNTTGSGTSTTNSNTKTDTYGGKVGLNI